MHRNGVLLPREHADRMRRIRIEIRRRLRALCDARKWPMSERLASLVRSMQHPNGLDKDGRPMTKPD
jgi:hypothetical protein